jgi:hypothetical protein
MRKMVFILFILATVVPGMAVKKKNQPVKIEVVDQAEGFQGKYQNGGIIGAAQGARTFSTATTVKTIINGDHALLRCYENHSGCNILGPGTYDGDIKLTGDQPDVWINYVRPLDHKVFREHWKVTGTW